MYNYNFLPIGWHFHWIFIGFLIVGLILFVRWTFLALNKEQIKTWAIWLIVAGALGMLLTANWGLEGMRYMHGNYDRTGYWMMGHMFNDEYQNFDTPEQWRKYMLEEMEERMGINI